MWCKMEIFLLCLQIEQCIHTTKSCLLFQLNQKEQCWPRQCVPGPQGITLSRHMQETKKQLKQRPVSCMISKGKAADFSSSPRTQKLNPDSDGSTRSTSLFLCVTAAGQLPILVNPASGHKNNSWPHIPWILCILASNCLF